MCNERAIDCEAPAPRWATGVEAVEASVTWESAVGEPVDGSVRETPSLIPHPSPATGVLARPWLSTGVTRLDDTSPVHGPVPVEGS